MSKTFFLIKLRYKRVKQIIYQKFTFLVRVKHIIYNYNNVLKYKQIIEKVPCYCKGTRIVIKLMLYLKIFKNVGSVLYKKNCNRKPAIKTFKLLYIQEAINTNSF